MSSVFRRFFNTILLFGLLPSVSVVGVVVYFQYLSKKEVITNYQRIADVFSFLSYEKIDNLAKRLDYLDYLRRIHHDENSFIKAVFERYQEAVFVALLDERGIEKKRVGLSQIAKSIPIVDISKERYFQRLVNSKEGVIGDFNIRGGFPLATVVYPVENEFVYILVNMKDFFKNIYHTRVGKTGFVFFVSDDGKVLADSNFKLPYNDIAKIVLQSSGSIETKIGKERYIVVFRKVGEFEFYVALAQGLREIFRDINIIFWLTLFLIFGLLTLSYFVSYKWAKSLTDPISALIDESYKVAQGDFSGSVDIKSSFSEMTTLIDVFNTMVRRLKEYESIQVEKIMDEREKLNVIMTNIRDGVALIELTGKPIYMNPACKEIVKDKEPREFFHKVVKEVALKGMKVVEVGQRSYELLYDLVKPQREKPIILLVLEDITTEMNIYKTKEEIFKSIVHDIRTPLLNMQGYIKLLSYDADERIKRYVVGLETESSIVFRMLENILDLARIENKTLKVERNRVDIGEFLGRIVERFKARSEFKNISLSFTKPNSPLYSELDEELFQRALENILSNAFKYTPSGGKVDVGVEKADEKIMIYVKDTGRGIEKERLKHIFERYRSFSKDGFGLGLSIAKAIVEMHGGRIEIVSEVGQGTKVMIFIDEVV